MNFLANLKIDGFNVRQLNESDAEIICEKENITLLELDVPASFYFYCYQKHFIIIKKGLLGLKKTFTIFHELGHFYCHAGSPASSRAFFYGLIKSKNEFEADAFATIAICPRTALDNYDFLESHPRSRFARNLFKERQRLEFLYQV